MAEGLRDTVLAKKDAVRRGADTDGEMADSLSSSDSASYNQTETTSSDFMFHYAFFGCLASRPGGWSLLQAVTNSFSLLAEHQNVADDYKLLQSVAKRKK